MCLQLNLSAVNLPHTNCFCLRGFTAWNHSDSTYLWRMYLTHCVCEGVCTCISKQRSLLLSHQWPLSLLQDSNCWGSTEGAFSQTQHLTHHVFIWHDTQFKYSYIDYIWTRRKELAWDSNSTPHPLLFSLPEWQTWWIVPSRLIISVVIFPTDHYLTIFNLTAEQM